MSHTLFSNDVDLAPTHISEPGEHRGACGCIPDAAALCAGPLDGADRQNSFWDLTSDIVLRVKLLGSPLPLAMAERRRSVSPGDVQSIFQAAHLCQVSVLPAAQDYTLR